ncbi:MAG: tRNA (adenosine(37)-N6)-threonylcarbamoyltransferase complex dimerization subunit type 1 TsaB [Deltaproteobacteria bacterium HGW-Deltaproteobacteria-20]|jgi:tRNA threonylcarbamoyladenosine biosynthesis protein TsaB|nr:MAG: tRNA (adenosine(37)-N6)-threonylcarbamoyltransferase complex dimerization subunit type 1 TsaB [Deltaproteobacteria bacterium HGW-Deltaproteobacteria-20]
MAEGSGHGCAPRVLVIDTATRRATVAVVQADQVLADAFHEQPSTHAERLLSMVDDVLARSVGSLACIDLLAVGMGPGSFTGVRVGMAVAKGLGFAGGIPGVGVTSLAAMAHAARQIVGDRLVIPMVDAKKGEVFLACFDGDGGLLAGPEHIPRDGVAGWLGAVSVTGPKAVVGEVAAELGLGEYQVTRGASCDLPGAQSMASLAVVQWTANHQDQIESLEPLYVRPPDITYPASRPPTLASNSTKGGGWA